MSPSISAKEKTSVPVSQMPGQGVCTSCEGHCSKELEVKISGARVTHSSHVSNHRRVCDSAWLHRLLIAFESVQTVKLGSVTAGVMAGYKQDCPATFRCLRPI